MSPPKRRAHSRLRGQPDPLLILQELSTNADIYEEGMATTAPSSGAEGRVHVRPVNPFIAEVLPPRAQQAAITREGGRAGARLKPRSSAGPGARSRPTRTLERFSEAPQKCVPRRPRTPTPGPAAGALRRGEDAGCIPDSDAIPTYPTCSAPHRPRTPLRSLPPPGPHSRGRRKGAGPSYAG